MGVSIIKHKGEIWVEVKHPKKPELQLRVERVIKKANKKHYLFNDIELAVFEAMGKADWNEEKINWLVLEQFDRLYAKFYP